MEIFLLLIFICIVSFGIALPLIKNRRKKIEHLINKWADENNLSIVSYDERHFSTPFFFLTRGRNKVVCKVTVSDDTGKRKKAWLLLGGYLKGISSDKIVCRWE